jgi:hypothetical protein
VAGSDDSIARQETVAETGTSAAPPSRPATGQDAPDFEELAIVEPDRYVVGGELARGGMGRILTARDRRLGRRVRSAP